MKTHRYQGPLGEVEFKDPFWLRIVDDSRFLGLCAVVFIAWTGYYLAFQDPRALSGRSLSPGHQKLAADCFVCHQPFQGVPDASCRQSGCHADLAVSQAHAQGMGKSCVQCHPPHSDGAFLPPPISNADCKACHDREQADPHSRFSADRLAQRTSVNLPRSLFPHAKHETSNYKCIQCHCLGKNTLKTPLEDLFTMKTCLMCKEHKAKADNCKLCHNYKNPKTRFHLELEPRPRRTCLTPDELARLIFKVQLCTPYLEREPGFKNLTVCGEELPATDWRP